MGARGGKRVRASSAVVPRSRFPPMSKNDAAIVVDVCLCARERATCESLRVDADTERVSGERQNPKSPVN